MKWIILTFSSEMATKWIVVIWDEIVNFFISNGAKIDGIKANTMTRKLFAYVVNDQILVEMIWYESKWVEMSRNGLKWVEMMMNGKNNDEMEK